MHGAATSPNADAFAFAAAQVKKALEFTHSLRAAGYVFRCRLPAYVTGREKSGKMAWPLDSGFCGG
jgi:xylose isomerase